MAFFISRLSSKLKKPHAKLRLQLSNIFYVMYANIKKLAPNKEHLKELLNCFLPFNPVKNFPGHLALALALAAGLAWASQTVPANGYFAYNTNLSAGAQDYRDIPDTVDSIPLSGENTSNVNNGMAIIDEADASRVEQQNQRPEYTQVSRGWVNRSDIYLMARVIEGEAADEPFVGKVAVGAVIVNRVNSGHFPHDVSQVVYQPLAFEAVQNGQYLRPLTNDSVKAANLAVQGWDPTNGALYYWNPVTAKSKWVWQRPIIMTIGRHVFAR